MDAYADEDSAEARATRARDALQARADSAGTAAGRPPPSADPSICDRYFYAAFVHFNLAAQAPDEATFLAYFEAGQAYLLLGQACQEQVGDGAPEPG